MQGALPVVPTDVAPARGDPIDFVHAIQKAQPRPIEGEPVRGQSLAGEENADLKLVLSLLVDMIFSRKRP